MVCKILLHLHISVLKRRPQSDVIDGIWTFPSDPAVFIGWHQILDDVRGLSRTLEQLTSRCICRVSNWHCAHVHRGTFRTFEATKWWIVPVINLCSIATFSFDLAKGMDGPSVGLYWQGKYFEHVCTDHRRVDLFCFSNDYPMLRAPSCRLE